MIIGVDMDGVQTEWDNAMDKLATTVFSHVKGIPLKHERKSFNFYDGQPEDVAQAIDDIMNYEHFYRDLDPIPGAITAVKDIAELHTVVFVTSPWITNATCVQDKFDWIAKHYGDDWRSKVIITKDKTLVRCDYLIDDKPSITGAVTPEWEQIIFDQPYNQGVPGKRMMSWADWRNVIV